MNPKFSSSIPSVLGTAKWFNTNSYCIQYNESKCDFKSYKWPQYSEFRCQATALPNSFLLQKTADFFPSFVQWGWHPQKVLYSIALQSWLQRTIRQCNYKSTDMGKCKTISSHILCNKARIIFQNEISSLNVSARVSTSLKCWTAVLALVSVALECYLQKLCKSETIKSQKKVQTKQQTNKPQMNQCPKTHYKWEIHFSSKKY